MLGQSLDPFPGTSPAVLTYLNEAPYNPGNTATAFFDLGSIQVLKGPQGTLFGRNATGGAVLYSTPMPGDEFSGFVRSEEHTSELQSLMRISYAVFCLKKKNKARKARSSTSFIWSNK